MNKILLILFLIIVITTDLWANDIDCNKHPIYCNIIRLAPNLDKSYAYELSNHIYKYTRKYDINDRLFTAILKQESNFDIEAKNCVKGLLQLTTDELRHEASKCAEDGFKFTGPNCQNFLKGKAEVKICRDFGIGQIYYKTADRYNINLNKILIDLDYAVESSIIILNDFKKRYSKKDKFWYTRYNSNNKIKRELYRKLVERYL